MLNKLAPLMFLAFAAAGWADPLATNTIPDDTRWVIHANVDAARNSPLWRIVADRFVKPRMANIAPKVAAVESLTGMVIPDGIHDVTLFGTAFDESTVCILVHAGVDQVRLTNYLKRDPEFTSSDHNGHTIVSWRDRDRDRLMYAAFAPNDVVILAPVPKTIYLTLDTLDKKSPAIQTTSPLAPPQTPRAAEAALSGPLLWIASLNISDLPRAHEASPMLLQIDTASIAIDSADDKISARFVIVAKADKIAQQITSVAEGVKAFVLLQESDEHARPGVKMVAAALQDLNIMAAGKNITAEWSVSAFKLDALAQVMMQSATPATAPAGAAGVGGGVGGTDTAILTNKKP